MNLPAKVLEIVKRALHSLPEIGRGLVVAVSGGADSVALLRLVLLVRKPGTPVVVAHFNHQLRGDESDADEHFVGDLCQQLIASGVVGLSWRCQRLDVLSLAREERMNLEAKARQLRYGWLAQVAHDAGCYWVATGHTANDQAETVLHRLLRGSGIRGLQGIASIRPLDEKVHLVRPLLQLSRDDLLNCLGKLDQPFREDQSNRDRRFTRNRIRLELLPLLAESYNPRIVELLAQLAEQAGEWSQCMEGAVTLLAKTEKPRAGELVILDRDSLSAARRPSVREVFRFLWQREQWSEEGMGFATWERLADLALGDRTALDATGLIHARHNGRVIQIGPRASFFPTYEIP